MISRARAACVSCAASALSRFSSSRARIDAIVRADSGVLSSVRSASASSADCASRAPASSRPKSRACAAQAPRVVAEKGLEQPQHRAPALHRLAEVVDRGRVRLCLVVQHRARFGQDVARDGPESLADRNIWTHGGFLGHARVL